MPTESNQPPSFTKKLLTWLRDFSAVLLIVGTFTTWLMGVGFQYRTGLDYPWLPTTYIQNLGSLGLDTLLYFGQILGSASVLLPAVMIGVVWFIVLRKWPDFIKRGINMKGWPRVRNNLPLGVAAILLVFYLLPSTQIRYQLKRPALATLNTSLRPYDVVGRVARWQQKLQVCAAVGNMKPELAKRRVGCSGHYGATEIARKKLHTLYVVYVCGALILLAFAVPEIRNFIAAMHRRGKARLDGATLFSATRIAAESVPILAVPWVYVMLCSALAPKYKIATSGLCSGYEIPANGDKVFLYDPTQPESEFPFKEDSVVARRGPRPGDDAFAGFLAEKLKRYDLSQFPPCSSPRAKPH